MLDQLNAVSGRGFEGKLSLFRIRELGAADIDALRMHFARCWRSSYQQLVGVALVEEMIAGLAPEDLGMIAPDGLALVAAETATGSLIGTAFAAERHGVVYIWGMYVSSDRMRCGIGRNLIDEIFNRFSGAKNFSAIVLQASPDAQNFYRSMGFVPANVCEHEIVRGEILPASVMIASGMS